MEKVMHGAEEMRFEGNEVGILVSHGFTGTTQSMKPLVETYARAGYTVYCPRLKGHGTSPEDMESTSHMDWVHSVEEAYTWLKERCSKIFVVGLSMGGTLALYMASEYRDIEGVIPINAAIDIPALENSQGTDERFLDAIGSDIKDPATVELAYDRTPVKSIGELVGLMDKVKDRLDEIHCPIMIFVSDEDHVVPPHNSEVIFESVFSEHKEIIHLENSYHVATLDHDKDMIIERTLEFFQMYTNTK
ncbi:alpha/beta fold hydrolase [Halobacillus trueperi]|uniref:Alpha/beta fold hydrolase n=1 Tax=Halobacillus trueperi TaxID=156205 RepID=A0A3D8VTQ0_9BACI|nr:alpha/beta fold hydrolase [Halobacillus trueperi]RDY72671.1 alpha/beta fold hydrolase [Halobacillus trueperi]